VAARVAALPAQVEDPIGAFDQMQVVLHNDDSVAGVHQAPQQPYRVGHIGGVQPSRGLIQGVEHAGHPLCLALRPREQLLEGVMSHVRLDKLSKLRHNDHAESSCERDDNATVPPRKRTERPAVKHTRPLLTDALIVGLSLALLLMLLPGPPRRSLAADGHDVSVFEVLATSASAGVATSYTVYLPVALNNYAPPVYLQTKIDNIWTFLDTCPQNDPAITRIRNDFIIRRNGSVVGEVACSEPYSQMPTEQVSDALTYLQALRTIYYMDPGVPGHLPWTSMSLYHWMASNIGGINIADGISGGYCCAIIDGKKYMVGAAADSATLEWRREWRGMSSLIDFIAHEVRHADGGPGHVTGCAAFPSGVYGCDANYDLSNLGSYGVQYWLHQAWMTAYLHIGIGCADESTALRTVEDHLWSCEGYRGRFVDPPPPLRLPDPPYGGPCYEP
jgi:hypothetical protein